MEYDWRARTGAAYEKDLAASLKELVDPLDDLLQGRPLTGTRRDIVRRLFAAKSRFDDDRPRLDRFVQVRGIRAAVQERNDAAFVASYGVRWHAAALRLDVQHYPLLAERDEGLGKLINALLPLCDQLDRILAGGGGQPRAIRHARRGSQEPAAGPAKLMGQRSPACQVRC